MQSEGTPVQLPRRCLFESLENKPSVVSERRFRSFKCQLEANKACQQSTERFRNLYAFDVDLLCACRRSPCRARQSCSATTDSISLGRLSTSCGSIAVLETERANWHWETVNLADEYVPSIYHTVRYHSDSCLRGHYRTEQPCIPPTPNKMRDRFRSSDVNVPSETEVSKEDLQVSKHSNTSPPDDSSPHFRMPSLFHMWRARIRRASHKERAHKSLVRDTTSPLSDEENIATPSEIPYTRKMLAAQLPPPVPNPSPVKSTTQEYDSVTTYKELLPLGDSNSSQIPPTKLRQMKLTGKSSSLSKPGALILGRRTRYHTLATVKAAIYFSYSWSDSILKGSSLRTLDIFSKLFDNTHPRSFNFQCGRWRMTWSDNRQRMTILSSGFTNVGRKQTSPNRLTDNTPYVLMSSAKESKDDDPTSEVLSTQSADSEPPKRPTKCELKSEKVKRLFGFGPDTNWLCWTNSWIGLSYFITGLILFLIHAITYSWSAGTLQLHCAEGRCWSFALEKNPYSHSYNLLRYTKYLYDDPHIGLGFGLFLLIFGVTSGFRFSRLLVNLGFICNVTLTATCILLLPFTIFELQLAYGSHAQAKLEAPCHWNRIRASNDLVMLVTMLLLSVFQLVINYPYVQYRSINRLGPLLYYIKTSQRLSNIRLKNNTTFNEFTV
ncbi:hypothetical protein T265_10206 [Opisthorchis viverrini]|uniref:Uncharacterized protein n=1 Tax=Opisthorchis viverrini TaxID=6198 RepID=A0A074ZE42_OPIVI|nr:hypothetical protein T265_10206 [Opisthorchis viverrini]KER21470.1 hypothetical protein T265_10206 [Opisthorchis viverrini]